jgi:hypothetical protein
VDLGSEAFVGYYLQGRETFAKAAERIASSLLPAAQAQAVANEVKQSELLMAFGEVALSYLAEIEDKIVLTRAGWWTEPYTIKQGTDLIGVDLDTGRIVYFESKALSDAQMAGLTMSKVASQLQRSSIDLRIRNKVKAESYLAVKAAFSNSPRRPTLPLHIIDPSIQYFRVGAITAPGTSWYLQLNSANPGDADENHLVSLMYIQAEEIKKSAHAQALLEINALQVLVDLQETADV